MPFADYVNFEDCVAKNQDKDDPEAYCATIKRQVEGENLRHPDFERIKHEFENYYCKGKTPCPKGEYEYYEWLRALSLDETREYSQAKESFQWAKNMIQKLKEDAKNVYYRVLAGFPIKSMNGYIYHERDLIAQAKSIIGKPINLNHKHEVEGIEYVDASYDDGAVEAILKVPKEASCPFCQDGKRIVDLIDEKKIVNVSLEGACQNNPALDAGDCRGFEFTGCALLTTDVLPGIPMARIFPLEAYVKPLSQSSSITLDAKNKKIKIEVIGLSKEEKTDPNAPKLNDLMATPDPTIPVKPPEGTTVAIGSPAASDTSTKPVEAEDIDITGEWDVCIRLMASRGYDEDSQKAICAAIKNSTVSHAMTFGLAKTQKEAISLIAEKVKTDKLFAYLNHKLTEATKTNPEKELALTDALLRVHDLERKTAQLTDQLAASNKTLDEQGLKSKKELGEITKENLHLEGRIAELEKLESRVSELNKAKIEDEGKIKDWQKRCQEATESRDQYKAQLEVSETENASLKEKYINMLKTNQGLSTKLTEQNEEWLKITKEKEATEEKLKKAKRLGKVVVKL